MSVMQKTAAVPRPSKALKSKSQPSAVPEAFDPNELSRRLYLVLADQRAQSERRRAVRAETERKAKEAANAADEGSSAAALAPSDARPTSKAVTSARDSARGASSKRKDAQPEPRKAISGKLAKSLLQRKASESSLRSKTSKASKKSGQAANCYVPKVAAAQFTRTTTAVGMRDPSSNLVHKLSQPALRFHLQGDKTLADEKTTGHLPPSGQMKALRRAQSKSERLHERNQFQRTAILEEAADAEEERAREREREEREQESLRHTFAGEFAQLLGDPAIKAARRSSTGDIVEGESGVRHSFAALELEDIDELEALDPQEHVRVDWTQSDEAKQSDEARQKSVVSPLLKRADSIWTLRGRLGSMTRHGRDEKDATAPSERDASEPLRSPKSSFFSRFKR